MARTDDLAVHQSNTEQLRAWDGDEGAYWTEHADYFDRSVATYHQRLLSTAAIVSGERVLDIGCGTGQTTRDAGRAAVDGTALGVDLSRRMVELARRRASEEALANVSFEQADAQIHPFTAGAFDVAISRTGAMFFGDPVAAFTNIAGAMVPGGRLALTAWQPLPANEWIMEISGALAAGREMGGPPPNAPGPFALSEPDHVRSILEAAGFTGVELEGCTAPMWFGTDADDAQGFVLGLMGWMLQGLDEAGRGRAIDGLHASMAAHATTAGVEFGSAVWTITAARS